METSHVKTIAVVATSRADYGRLFPVMRAIRERVDLRLLTIVGTNSFVNSLWWSLRHGDIMRALQFLFWRLELLFARLLGKGEEVTDPSYVARLFAKDGFAIDARIPVLRKGGDTSAMLMGASATLGKIGNILDQLSPDVVLIYGDRFELLPIAMATALKNIPLAHIEGGDVSGTIDESVRHALSKLAHIHFPLTKKSHERLLRMGEHPDRVFTVGMPVIDMLRELTANEPQNPDTQDNGQGSVLDFSEPYVLVIYHPVTTRGEHNKTDVEELLGALQEHPLQKVIVGSNVDAGASFISDRIWQFALEGAHRTRFYKSVPLFTFYRLMKNAAVAVGNSSSFLREAAYLGIPVVLVGDRQAGRERGDNVIEVPHDRAKIKDAIVSQSKRGVCPPDFRFGDGTSGPRIAEILASLDVKSMSLQKKFHE